MKPSSRRLISSAILLAVISSAGCAATAEIPKETTPPKEVKVAKTFPLTGAEVPTNVEGTELRPVVIAKIDNSPDARPQEGLNSSDIVFEELVEGGITRFAGIWHSSFPSRVGPIRSVRPMDPDIASPFGGMIAYSGGQLKFVLKMRATELYNASETSEQSKKTMIRTPERFAPHNLFLLPEKIQSQHLDLAEPGTWQNFTTEATKVSTNRGKTVLQATARFPETTVVWVYDSSMEKFVRYQDGKMAVDGTNSRRVVTENLIMINVDIDRSEVDKRYGHIPRTVVNGEGTGFYLNDGKQIPITWHKKDRKAKYVFKTLTGKTITMAAGNTWVELVPTDNNGKIILK